MALVAMLRAPIEQMPHLSFAAHAAMTRTLVDLLSVAVNPFGSGACSEFYRPELARFEAVRLIEANIEVADVSIQDIVRAAGIPRTGLYRLFESFGGIARFIQLCRLQQLRDRLDNRAFDDTSLAELAPTLGFADESHASRLFKQAFRHRAGCLPHGTYSRVAGVGGRQDRERLEQPSDRNAVTRRSRALSRNSVPDMRHADMTRPVHSPWHRPLPQDEKTFTDRCKWRNVAEFVVP